MVSDFCKLFFALCSNDSTALSDTSRIAAISLTGSPSTFCRLYAIRCCAGNFLIAAKRIAASCFFSSCTPGCIKSGASVSGFPSVPQADLTQANLLLRSSFRRWSLDRFTVIRYSHVPIPELPLNPSIDRHASKNTSWVISAASCSCCTIPRAVLYMLSFQSRTSSLKAASSLCCKRCMIPASFKSAVLLLQANLTLPC